MRSFQVIKKAEWSIFLYTPLNTANKQGLFIWTNTNLIARIVFIGSAIWFSDTAEHRGSVEKSRLRSILTKLDIRPSFWRTRGWSPIVEQSVRVISVTRIERTFGELIIKNNGAR